MTSSLLNRVCHLLDQHLDSKRPEKRSTNFARLQQAQLRLRDLVLNRHQKEKDIIMYLRSLAASTLAASFENDRGMLILASFAAPESYTSRYATQVLANVNYCTQT